MTRLAPAIIIGAAMWAGIILAVRRGGLLALLAVALFFAVGTLALFADGTANDDPAPKVATTKVDAK